MNNRKLKLLGCLFLFTLFLQPLRLAADSNAVPVAVVVGFDGGRVKYEVDSKPVRSDKILEVFMEVKKQRGGRDVPVVVLIDERNSIAALSNIRGIVNKAGFSRVRYFCFSADRKMMQETIEQPAIPFSLNPEPPTTKNSNP